MKKIKVISVALTVIPALGSLWYWALFGMSREVGFAWQMTSLVMLIGVFAVFITDFLRRSR